LASEDSGFFTPGGLYKPNNIFVDFGRAYYLENVAHMIDQLIDLCGRAIVIHPSEADFQNPEIGPKLAALFRGRGISAKETPLFVIRLLTMQRVEYASDGPLFALARNMVGIGDATELASRANAEEDRYYAAAKYRPDYIKGQDVKPSTIK
jgi:4-hydroxyphenylacetate 3-monooxygenase